MTVKHTYKCLAETIHTFLELIQLLRESVVRKRADEQRTIYTRHPPLGAATERRLQAGVYCALRGVGIIHWSMLILQPDCSLRRSNTAMLPDAASARAVVGLGLCIAHDHCSVVHTEHQRGIGAKEAKQLNYCRGIAERSVPYESTSKVNYTTILIVCESVKVTRCKW